MDSFAVLPEELYDNILKHLCSKDILALSQVSRGWYDRLSKSRRCMDKLTIYCKLNTYSHEEDIEYLLNSSRNYRKIVAASFWRKNGDLDTSEFENEKKVEQVEQILQKFANSLEYIESSIDYPDIGEMPNLRALRVPYSIYKVPTELYWEGIIYTNRNYIQKLDFAATSADEYCIEMFKDVLKEMKYLKFLRTNVNIFDKPVSGQYQFLQQLETLKLPASTLGDEELSFIFTEMPKLRTFEFHFYNVEHIVYFDENGLLLKAPYPKLPINETITLLRCCNNFATFHLSSLKKVKKLWIISMNIETLTAVLASSSLLKVYFFMILRRDLQYILEKINGQQRIKFYSDFYKKYKKFDFEKEELDDEDGDQDRDQYTVSETTWHVIG